MRGCALQIESNARKGSLTHGEKVIAKDVMSCFLAGKDYSSEHFRSTVSKLFREDHYTAETQDALYMVMKALEISDADLEQLYLDLLGHNGSYDGGLQN